VKYRTETGNVAHGIRAKIIPNICDVWMDAEEDGTLGSRQKQIARNAKLIIRALAHVGITALVDEATGYQNDRARDALAKILQEFISQELRAWTRTFPLEFYKEIFRLKKWPFDPAKVKRPSVIGHYTNNFVYQRLAPGVLEELRAKNPVVDGRRKHKLFQWLTGEIGDPKLRAHLDGVIRVMRGSVSWEEFVVFMDKFYPVIETTALGFETEIRKS
ncbi:MAG: P63C domain-containing protein, partial [Candidatus Micrarchaeaceae archaeon]